MTWWQEYRRELRQVVSDCVSPDAVAIVTVWVGVTVVVAAGIVLLVLWMVMP